mgnify:CR=1 FL=1
MDAAELIEVSMGEKPKQKPRLTEDEMSDLAVKTVQEYINACHCKNTDDVLLALGHWLNIGISAGETVKHGTMVTIQ